MNIWLEVSSKAVQIALFIFSTFNLRFFFLGFTMLFALMEVCLERRGGDLDIVSQSSSWCMSWDRRLEGISSTSVLGVSVW